MAGRKPKPTALKKLEGNPGKRKMNTKEPVPAKGINPCFERINCLACCLVSVCNSTFPLVNPQFFCILVSLPRICLPVLLPHI